MTDLPTKDVKPTRKRSAHRTRYLPARFKPGFAWDLNRRSSLARDVARELWELWQDLGGFDQLSTQQRIVVERIVYVRRKLLEHEKEVLEGKPGLLEPNVYAAWCNTLVGLLKSLGIERKAKPVGTLHDYIANRGAPAPLAPQVKRPAADPADVASESVASQRPSEDLEP